MFITSYSDFKIPLNEYPKKLKGKSLHTWIIKSLKNRNRISIWELQENRRMLRTVLFLESLGRIKLFNQGHSYPYIGVSVGNV